MDGGVLVLNGDDQDSHNYVFDNGKAGIFMEDGYLTLGHSLVYDNCQSQVISYDSDTFTAGLFIAGGDPSQGSGYSYMAGSCVMGNTFAMGASANHDMQVVNGSMSTTQVGLYAPYNYWGVLFLNPETWAVWDYDDNASYGDVDVINDWNSCPYSRITHDWE
jgi:hypothetical protein